jgi:hypothetical protein
MSKGHIVLTLLELIISSHKTCCMNSYNLATDEKSSKQVNKLSIMEIKGS